MLVPFTSLSDDARVWVYSSNKFFNNGDESQIEEHLNGFLQQWTAHAKNLKASYKLDLRRHLIISVDESEVGASGCSIDSCVHFLQRLGRQYDHDFFDRLNYTYLGEDKRPFMIHHQALEEAYDKEVIHDDTIFVNPLVKNIGEYRTDFLQPLARSFHARFISKLN